MLNSIRREVHSNQALESISTDVFNGVTMSYVGGRSTTIEIKGNNKLAKIEKHAFRGVVHPEEDDFSIYVESNNALETMEPLTFDGVKTKGAIIIGSNANSLKVLPSFLFSGLTASRM